MKKTLNLTSKWEDNEILEVSWNEIVYFDQSNLSALKALILVIIFGLVLCFGLILDGIIGLIIVLSSIAIILGTIIYFQIGNKVTRNNVKFSKDVTTLKGSTYNTSDITRFDYGSNSNLTGSRPIKDKDGNTSYDPTIVRMWIDNSTPVRISENNWTFEENHQIRDALDKALQKVQAEEKAAVKEAQFGKQGDFGVPDY